jgi:hypothetical protein
VLDTVDIENYISVPKTEGQKLAGALKAGTNPFTRRVNRGRRAGRAGTDDQHIVSVTLIQLTLRRPGAGYRGYRKLHFGAENRRPEAGRGPESARLAAEAFAHQAGTNPFTRRVNRGRRAGRAGTDDQHIVGQGRMTLTEIVAKVDTGAEKRAAEELNQRDAYDCAR